MKAKNHKKIQQGYWRFSLFLAFCVAIGVANYYCYLQTNKVEVNRIVEKTEEYDKIYVQQTELVSRIDSLYQYMLLFNTNKNDAMLQNVVSKHKQEIVESMEDMNGRDVKMYQKLMSQVNSFLSAKDSIRILKTEEDLIRIDLKKCMEENKQASRKLTIGSITINK